MPVLAWSEEFSVNVAEIDEQHKKLCDYVNRLHAGVADRVDREDLRQLLVDLVDYTRLHFATEERLMDEHGMQPGTRHRKEHETLLRLLEDTVKSISEGNHPIFYSKYDVSNDWFLAHIMDHDKKLGAFLNSKGVY